MTKITRREFARAFGSHLDRILEGEVFEIDGKLIGVLSDNVRQTGGDLVKEMGSELSGGMGAVEIFERLKAKSEEERKLLLAGVEKMFKKYIEYPKFLVESKVDLEQEMINYPQEYKSGGVINRSIIQDYGVVPELEDTRGIQYVMVERWRVDPDCFADEMNTWIKWPADKVAKGVPTRPYVESAPEELAVHDLKVTMRPQAKMNDGSKPNPKPVSKKKKDK